MAATKERVKQVLDELDALDLEDGEFWKRAERETGMARADLFTMIAEKPGYFGFVRSN